MNVEVKAQVADGIGGGTIGQLPVFVLHSQPRKPGPAFRLHRFQEFIGMTAEESGYKVFGSARYLRIRMGLTGYQCGGGKMVDLRKFEVSNFTDSEFRMSKQKDAD